MVKFMSTKKKRIEMSIKLYPFYYGVLGNVIFNKIYNKLKTKYEGYTLKTKLKQKLYLKGFTSEEINDFIEKTVH